MNKKILETILTWPKAYIDGADLMHILDGSPDSRYGIVKRAVKNGSLIPLRRELYVIKNSKFTIGSFELSSLIYAPSYVSLESALSYHGWISDPVQGTTCVTTKRTKAFTNGLGEFSYHHIPAESFNIGIKDVKLNNGKMSIAHPLKALADMVYTQKMVWKTPAEVSSDLQLDPDWYKSLDLNLLNELLKNYPSARVKLFTQMIIQNIGHLKSLTQETNADNK